MQKPMRLAVLFYRNIIAEEFMRIYTVLLSK